MNVTQERKDLPPNPTEAASLLWQELRGMDLELQAAILNELMFLVKEDRLRRLKEEEEKIEYAQKAILHLNELTYITNAYINALDRNESEPCRTSISDQDINQRIKSARY